MPLQGALLLPGLKFTSLLSLLTQTVFFFFKSSVFQGWLKISRTQKKLQTAALEHIKRRTLVCVTVWALGLVFNLCLVQILSSGLF